MQNHPLLQPGINHQPTHLRHKPSAKLILGCLTTSPATNYRKESRQDRESLDQKSFASAGDYFLSISTFSPLMHDSNVIFHVKQNWNTALLWTPEGEFFHCCEQHMHPSNAFLGVSSSFMMSLL